MDEEALQQGLRVLEELVLDAGEPVSYRRLASTLCVHVNHSKSLLKQFTDMHAEDKGLYVSVLVCGSINDRNVRTVICPRTELKDVKESFKTIIFEHIYGVSKSRAALEGAALAAAAGGFEDFTPTVGAIRSALCVKRSDEEIDKLKMNSYKSLENDMKQSSHNTVKNEISDSKNKQNGISVNVKQNKIKETNSAPSTEAKSSTTVEDQHNKSKQNKSTKVQGKKDISSFFNRGVGKTSTKPASKPKEEPKVSNPLPKENINIKPEPVTLTKEEEPKERNPLPEEDIKIKPEPATPKKEETQTNNTEKKVKFKDHKNNLSKAEVKKSTSKSTKIVRTERNCKVDKKRKRVLRISDSEDSDNDKDPFEESPKETKIESDEDVIPPTPNADVVKITSGIANPKKRRKIIDKTYTTEDGYMVTRKEEVYESCSDEDFEMKENIVKQNVKEPIVIKKTPIAAPARKSKKKMASPQKSKQSSIQSFFKKK